jgi:tRNA uridine 5-carboxymethylaminomethyl modification enzyme
LRRDQAYIGVLIDDLITKGTEEPYRMFTSRAEYRTLLRQDNADTRLTPLSHKIGLASDERLEVMEKSQQQADSLVRFMKKTSIKPQEINPILQDKETAEIKQSTKLAKILARPQLKMDDLLQIESINLYFEENKTTQTTLEQAEIQIKYAGYIEKEEAQAQKLDRLESIKIPKGFDYHSIQSISTEARQKLTEIQPQTLSQASRISGVSPSDISVLLVHMGR